MSVHPPILLGTLGMTDSIILMVMALVVFGPRRLPQIGRQIGRLMYEFRKASNDFKFQMEEELRNAEEADRRKKEEERQRSQAALKAPEQESDPPGSVASSPDPGQTQSENGPEHPPLRIAPPSVGETIPAERPYSASATTPGSGDPPDESPAPAGDNSSSASSQNPSSDAAEALNHHG